MKNFENSLKLTKTLKKIKRDRRTDGRTDQPTDRVTYRVASNNTVESRFIRSKGPASNGNPPIMEPILRSLEKYFIILYIGNNRNPPIPDKNGWSLEFRWSGS